MAKRFSVNPNTVQRLLNRYRQTGDVAPKAIGGKRFKALLEAHEQQLTDLVAQHPDWTLAQYQEYFRQTYQIEASQSTFCRHLQKLGLSLKKNSAGQPSR